MDNIKEYIEKIFNKVTTDKDFQEKFKNEPIKAVEELLNVDLPDEAINNIINGVKAKLTADTAKDMLDKAMDFFKKED